MTTAVNRTRVAIAGTRGSVVVPVLFLAALLTPFVTRNPFFLSTGVVALEFVALAVMFDLVAGRVGALTLAQPLFFAFGSYAAALLGRHGVTGIPAQAGVAMLGAVLLGLLVGIPSFRLSLHSFAIGTLAFGHIGLLVATNWISVTEGPLCITGVAPASFSVFGVQLLDGTLRSQFHLALGVATVAVLAVVVIEGLGLRLPITGVRDEPVLAEARGFSATGTRLSVFVTAAAFTSLVGVFDAQFQSVVCPDNASFVYMMPLLLMVFIGGRASLRGVVLAAVLFTLLPQVLRMADEWRLVIYGGVLLVAISVFPDGLERALQHGGRLGGWLLRSARGGKSDGKGSAS